MPNQVDDVLLHTMDDSELSGAHLTEMLALICWASLCPEAKNPILRALNTFQPH
jgi:hypothetical protein